MHVENIQEHQFHRMNKSNAKLFPDWGNYGSRLPEEVINDFQFCRDSGMGGDFDILDRRVKTIFFEDFYFKV